MSKRELKKEHILNAGLEVMKAQGYNGTSVKDIVVAANVPKGSFYNYFDSKESFAVEALEQAALESHQMNRKMLANLQMPPLQRLQFFFECCADDACEYEFKTGCFLGNMCQEMADSSNAIRIKVRQVLREGTQLFEDILDEAKQSGEISEKTDTKTVAEFIFNAWEGALMRMKASKCREPLDAFLTMLPIVINSQK